jgi:hypothetical protein
LYFQVLGFAQNIDLNKGTKKTVITPKYNLNMLMKKSYQFLINRKTYRFLLDTGAINLITKNLAETLKPKGLQEIKVSDANYNKSSMNFVELQISP